MAESTPVTASRISSLLLQDSSPYVCYCAVVQKTIWGRRPLPQITLVFLFVAAASLATAAASKSQTFSLPESILLFGNYQDLRVVTPDGELKLRPPIDEGYNGGYFAFPGISPRGDAVAWGFAVARQENRKQNRARFALGVYSLPHQQWKTFGDFDGIGIAAYSSDGSRIVIVADGNGERQLLIFDVARETWTSAPYPTGELRRQTTMGWSPDNTRLVVEVQRGGLPYSPQMSQADADRNPVIAILDIPSGKVHKLGEGFNPTWSSRWSVDRPFRTKRGGMCRGAPGWDGAQGRQTIQAIAVLFHRRNEF